ncbi:unnamed protein product, partial [Staurois parvus]
GCSHLTPSHLAYSRLTAGWDTSPSDKAMYDVLSEGAAHMAAGQQRNLPAAVSTGHNR